MSQFRNIVKKAVVIGLCICTFSVQVSGATPWSSANGIFYDGNGNEIKGAIAKGIDVSYHKGDIDWAKVKAAGISFALLRCGYGNDERNQDDIKFVQNVKGCEDNGIQYGVYLYSYAVGNDKEKTLEDMARSEAEHVLRMIEEAGAKPTMPVYYDIEDKSQVEMTTKQYGDMAETFCNIVKNAGYKVGVYSNYYWWTNRLTDSRFDNWGKWVARYNNTSEYNKEYDIWQYTESGTVDGVGSGMDVNILLSRPCSITGHQYEFCQLVSKSTTTINGKATYKCKTCGHIKTIDIAKINQITISKTKYEYTGKAFKPTVTVKDSNGQVISTQNYNIIYSSNKKVGNGTVKIVFKGNYSGTITKIFKIVPKKVSLTKATNIKGKKVKLGWKKISGISGYEIQYGTNKSFKKAKTTTAKSSLKTKTITKLKNKKKYYFRMRAYKKVSGTKVYGVYSSKKTVKITK
ncbi:GH25 family lysozyme [Eubacterium ventriosum]|uniref:GH25 family lysozyme n=1 Tax=Eubacterium ventriosum TaxID=39496 RepID=UPI003991E254